MSRYKQVSLYLILSVIIVSLGGFLFGYNTSVISGALLFISEEFHFTSLQQELIVSTLLIGALIGALLGGGMADKLGRKTTMFFTVFLFTLGALLMVIAESLTGFLVGRFTLGLGVGVASLCVPLYIAEVSLPKIRGALVSFNQLAITIGILVAYGVDYGFSSLANWHWMFGFAFLPTLLLFIGLFWIQETPSWLANNGRGSEAKRSLQKLYPTVSLSHFEGEASKQKKSAKISLLSKGVRLPFITGIGISVFQQITGINVIIYYAPRIFQAAGYQDAQTAILATLGIGIVNVIMTVIALWVIDKVGRKPLLIIGLIGMIFSLLIIGFSFYEEAKDLGIAAVISMVAYVAFFAISLGPVAWLIISEIYPLSIRGKAMGIAIFANWVCNYLVSLTFLSMLQTFSEAGTFLIYAGVCLLGLGFVSKWVPETKNKSFEEIQKFWNK